MTHVTSVSVVVPVKDGARFLQQLLTSVFGQADAAESVEVLVLDSGSTDASVAIARSGGARVLTIEPQSFGHGRTRNLGAEKTSGDVIAFLTQDATPVDGWLAGLLSGFQLADDVGAVYGPHLARPETSPMIARELEAFFATHESSGGGPTVQRNGDQPFLSNVNAGYLRSCWQSLRFPDVAYSEDQAFARAMLTAGWAKAYVPAAAVLHAHNYSQRDFMRRYYDEYRGLRATIGHVEPFGLRSAQRDVRQLVGDDLRWARERGIDSHGLLRRSTIHHSGRKVFSSLGSRAQSTPALVQRKLSLEATVASRPNLKDGSPPDGPPPSRFISKAKRPVAWDIVRRYAKEGPAALLTTLSSQAHNGGLHIACVVPPFSRGSGGHNSILQIMSRLERIGYTVSYWIDDPFDVMNGMRPARIRRDMRNWFAPIEGPVFKGFDDWFGADVAVATGWQTAHQVVMLPACRGRAYLIHDHESEFYPTSVESRFAESTYALDMYPICASPWLENLVQNRYGRPTSGFDFGVDHSSYFPRSVQRDRNTIALYGRDVTARRAVPLALMAIEELRERLPELRLLVFGNLDEIDVPADYEHFGILEPNQLAWVYSRAAIGLVLSLTNYSLIPQEMMACGLPCVDLAGVSAEGVFGGDGPVALSPFDPLELADTIQRVLQNEAEWAGRSAAGLAFVKERNWERSARQVESGLRRALHWRDHP